MAVAWATAIVVVSGFFDPAMGCAEAPRTHRRGSVGVRVCREDWSASAIDALPTAP
jgi:hypothetical protein